RPIIIRAAGPPQGANCTPLGGSERSERGGPHKPREGPPRARRASPLGGSERSELGGPHKPREGPPRARRASPLGGERSELGAHIVSSRTAPACSVLRRAIGLST